MSTKTTITLALALLVGWPLASIFLPAGLIPLAFWLAWMVPRRIYSAESEDSVLEARRAVRLLELHANNRKGKS